MKPDRVERCGVLAVGGSGAAITAAILASENGADVAIASKGKFGFSGNAIMAGGGFGIDGYNAKHLLGIEAADESFTPDRLFDCVVKEGYFLGDQRLIRQYVDESPAIVGRFLGWAERGKQVFNFYRPGNWQSAGLSWGRAMRRGLDEAERVRRFEDVTVVEILTENNAVTGALAIDVYSGDVILFETPAVVIGTGGYQPFSMKNTVTDMTGDGAGMAFRAGARLADMEFLLAFPTAVYPREARGSIYPFIFEYFMRGLEYDVRDRDGRLLDIPPEIIAMSRGGKLSKLVSSYYWGYALDEGRGGPNGGMFYDYSRNGREKMDEAFALFNRTFSHWHKQDYYKGDPLAKVKAKMYAGEPLEVGLGYEYSMGGILVDEAMRTGVDGLFAAGEAASGVFGACRVGDGLTEMLCQGFRAGLSAAAYVKDADAKPPSPASVEAKLEKILGVLGRAGGVNPIAAQGEIERAADGGFGFVRCEEGLSASLAKVRALRADLPFRAGVGNSSRAYNWEWLTALQMENLALCVEAGILSALERRESRGCHIRKDYPGVDHDNFLYRSVCADDGKGGLRLEKSAPAVAGLQPPSGRHPDIMEYFTSERIAYRKR